jgi:hypothetical protein
MSGITHYSTLTALAVLGFYPTPVCNQRTIYDPVLKPPTALVPRVYLITMLFKLLLVVWSVVRTRSPIDWYTILTYNPVRQPKQQSLVRVYRTGYPNLVRALGPTHIVLSYSNILH